MLIKIMQTDPVTDWLIVTLFGVLIMLVGWIGNNIYNKVESTATALISQTQQMNEIHKMYLMSIEEVRSLVSTVSSVQDRLNDAFEKLHTHDIDIVIIRKELNLDANRK